MVKYNIKHCASGIVVICFNNIDNGCEYSRRNSYWYDFDEWSIKFTKDDLKLEEGPYIVTEYCEHDQVCFYHIPFRLLE